MPKDTDCQKSQRKNEQQSWRDMEIGQGAYVMGQIASYLFLQSKIDFKFEFVEIELKLN